MSAAPGAISLAEALGAVPADATGGMDMGQRAKRKQTDMEVDALRRNLNAAADSVSPDDTLLPRPAKRARADPSLSMLLQQQHMGLSDGEAVVRIAPIIDINAQKNMGPLRADGQPWPFGGPVNQPYSGAWLEREARQLNITAQNRTMRFIGVLAKEMNRKPLSFFNVDALRAQQQADAMIRAQAMRLDVARKVVPVDEKRKQMEVLLAELGKINAALQVLEPPLGDTIIPMPPYSDGTEVTRSLLNPNIEPSEPLLHLYPRESPAAADAEKAAEDAHLVPEIGEPPSYGRDYENNQLHSLFALLERTRLVELAERLAEPDNPKVLHKSKATAMPMTPDDRLNAIGYITTQWSGRYDAESMATRDETEIRELFFATWAYDALRAQHRDTPIDLALATWHGAAALQLFANFVLLKSTIELVQPDDVALVTALQKHVQAVVGASDASPPAYIHAKAWIALGRAVLSIKTTADNVFEESDPFRVKLIDTLAELLKALEHLRSKQSLVTLRGTTETDVDGSALRGTIWTESIVKQFNLNPPTAPGFVTPVGLLDPAALAAIHALSLAASVRPDDATQRALAWTEPPPRAAIFASSTQYLDALAKVKGALVENSALVKQFAILGRNIVIAQSRPDVKILQDLGRALGWVDSGTLRAIRTLALMAIRLLARVHVEYLVRHGAVEPAAQWDVLHPLSQHPTGSSDQQRIQRVFLWHMLAPLVALPVDLRAHRDDLSARVLKASQKDVEKDVSTSVKTLSLIATEVPEALLAMLAAIQMERARHERVELEEQRTRIHAEIGAARKIMADLAGEVPRDPTRLVQPESYVQDFAWIQQPFVGGMAVLNQETIGAIDVARAAVDRWVPGLRDAPLELLTEHFESGLAVSFAQLVAVLDAKSELLHERDYLRSEHYREVPKRFHEAIKALQRYRAARAGPTQFNVFDESTQRAWYAATAGATADMAPRTGLDSYTVF